MDNWNNMKDEKRKDPYEPIGEVEVTDDVCGYVIGQRIQYYSYSNGVYWFVKDADKYLHSGIHETQCKEVPTGINDPLVDLIYKDTVDDFYEDITDNVGFAVLHFRNGIAAALKYMEKEETTDIPDEIISRLSNHWLHKDMFKNDSRKDRKSNNRSSG